MTEHTKRLLKLLREASDLIIERGFQRGSVQVQATGAANLTIVGAIKLALGHRPNATVDQLGRDGLMFASAVHYINIFMGQRSFRDWCEDPSHTKTHASLLLKTMAAELERRTQNAHQ